MILNVDCINSANFHINIVSQTSVICQIKLFFIPYFINSCNNSTFHSWVTNTFFQGYVSSYNCIRTIIIVQITSEELSRRALTGASQPENADNHMVRSLPSFSGGRGHHRQSWMLRGNKIQFYERQPRLVNLRCIWKGVVVYHYSLAYGDRNFQ